MSKIKLLAVSCLVTIPLMGCESDSDDEKQVFKQENAVDYAAPEIVLNGGDVTIAIGETYTDAGATAIDNVDGDVTAGITVVSNVNTDLPGEYSVTYTVSDSVGNEGTLVRTVTVPDSILPEITMIGGDLSISQNSTYSDEGATAMDNVDGDITATIVTVNSVDTSTLGAYTVTYNVIDAAGNAAIEVVRTVTVEEYIPDTIHPELTMLGGTITVNVGETFTDEGATAFDNVDGDITSTIVATSTVDTATVGEYTVTYSVSDAAGNEAEEKVRTVKVIPVMAGVDIITDAYPKRALQQVKFGGEVDRGAQQMFDSNNGTKLIDHMADSMGFDLVRFSLHASLAVDDPIYSHIQTAAAYAKTKGMKVLVAISRSAGVWGNGDDPLDEDEKYGAITNCAAECPDNVRGLDLTAYAAYIDTFLANMDAAGASVDYLLPFSHDNVTADDYEKLWNAMTADDANQFISVGPEEVNVVGAGEKFAAVASQVDIAGVNADDKRDLTIEAHQLAWEDVAEAAKSASAPLWFSESQIWNIGSNNDAQLVAGFSNIIPAIRAGADRIILSRHAAQFAWFNGGFVNYKARSIAEFVAGANGTVVESKVYSDNVTGITFREGNTLYAMYTNESDADVELAIRLQEDETVDAANADLAAALWGKGGNNNTSATPTVNDSNDIIQINLPAGNFIKLTIPLTPQG